jgi:short-subunit dehydrogenase
MPRPAPRTFTGAVVLLTGAASGMGEQMALQLAEEGAATLVLLDRHAPRLEAVATDVRGRAPRAEVVTHVVDLGDRQGLDEIAARLSAELTHVDLLVNNAGVSMYGRFDEMTTDDFFWLTDINLRAPIVLTHALLPALKSAPGSHIVNLSSIFGLIAPGGQTAYVTSKFALRGFGEALRVELMRDGIGVTTVHPGGIRTRIATDGRRAANASEAGHARQLRLAAKALRMPPEKAAATILDAARKRRPRVVVGLDAKALQWVPRLLPSRMGELLAFGDRSER